MVASELLKKVNERANLLNISASNGPEWGLEMIGSVFNHDRGGPKHKNTYFY